jgi:hypothetical protein
MYSQKTAALAISGLSLDWINPAAMHFTISPAKVGFEENLRQQEWGSKPNFAWNSTNSAKVPEKSIVFSPAWSCH